MKPQPEIISPGAACTMDYFDEIADIAQLPPDELNRLLKAQIDALQVKANHQALRCMRELAQPELVGIKREGITKELMGLGMFADALSRQRVNLGKLGDGAVRDAGPTVQIPETMADSDWEKKYSKATGSYLPQLPAKGKTQ